ncbi:MAG: hypothetical protein CM1200mP30_09640 [Pseudomonadota bacterium]|nr:MAG: hypothetical protein CM1200mP30_09640 [Pseudomonadota bacterium]
MQEKTLFTILATCIYVLFSSVLWAATPFKAELDKKFSKLIKNGSVTVASDKWILYRYPPKQNSMLVPASVQKYATRLQPCIFLVLNKNFRQIFIWIRIMSWGKDMEILFWFQKNGKK